ncbi:ribosomal protein S18 [Cerioporus squamosus]|nr:ribosomal protein S18 [Cerioporus squamosus]
MLSAATSSLRTAARRQTFKLPSAVATRAASRSARVSADGPQTMEEFSEAVLDVAEEQEIIRAGRASEIEDNIVDSAPVIGSKDYPTLRGFQPGQFTRPRSFSRAEYDKGRSWTKRPLLGPDAATSKELDVFYQRNLDPLKECRNTSLLSRFVTAMGKIRGRSETNLTWKNQRRMGKAIRRAKMMGIIPVLSKRPLFLDDKDGL